MGAIGQRSHLGIGKETTFGTAVAATDYLKFNSESIVLSAEELVSAQLGRRDEPESYQGLKSVAGDSVHEVHPKALGHLLRSWFGAPVTTTLDTGIYLHVFTPATAAFSSKCEVPPYTLEVHRDLSSAFQISGAVVNGLAFNFGTGAKILQLTASWLAKDAALITKTSPAMETTDPFRWQQAVIGIGTTDSGTATGTQSATTLQDTGKTWVVNAHTGKYVYLTGGTGQGQIRVIASNTADTLTIATWGVTPVAASTTYEIFEFNKELDALTLNLTNGLVAKPILNGESVIDRVVADGFRSGALTPTFKLENLDQYNNFVAFTQKKWRVSFIGDTISGNHKYTLDFEMPDVRLTGAPISIGGPAELMLAAAAKIKYDKTAGYMCKVRLVNNVASY